MCGRFALFSNIDVILKYADLIDSDLQWTPHYNISPSMAVPVLINKSNQIAIDMQKWGYIPGFTTAHSQNKSIFTIINAKAEMINEKPLFKTSFLKRRCLIPANGFYEWRKDDRQPFYITIKDQLMIFFAGIWNSPHTADQTTQGNFAIITTNANSELEIIHQRMPVIIHPGRIKEWLFASDQLLLQDMLRPYTPEETLVQPVSREVNHSKIDHPELIKKIENL